MAIMDLPVFAAMRSKMEWHQARQGLLAENVANSETPSYSGRDLKAFDFESMMRQSSANLVVAQTTHSAHISVSSGSQDQFGLRSSATFEMTPEGNAVELEEEMMKVAANQLDYQAVTSLYTRSLRLLKTAFGRG